MFRTTYWCVECGKKFSVLSLLCWFVNDGPETHNIDDVCHARKASIACPWCGDRDRYTKRRKPADLDWLRSTHFSIDLRPVRKER